MNTSHKSAWLLAMALLSPGAMAALGIGEEAPNFTAQASLNGLVMPFSLGSELRKGPVVVYFFPSAFSTGCSIEAHNFSEAMDQFKALGATVVGISRDDIEVQKKFSVSPTACQGKFAVAADPDMSIAKSYDAVMTTRPDYANRVSYVISPNGKVAYRYSSLNPGKHVENTLKALKDLLSPTAAK